jgi:hypothetical protein
MLTLLTDHGHIDGHTGDDEQSQQFAAEVRELNRDWQPGRIPRVPRVYSSSVFRRVPVVHIPERRERIARPR